MAGPPAGMTPPLATVIRARAAPRRTASTPPWSSWPDRATSPSATWTRCGKVKSDDDAEPADRPRHRRPAAAARPQGARRTPEAEAYETIRVAPGTATGSSPGGALWRPQRPARLRSRMSWRRRRCGSAGSTRMPSPHDHPLERSSASPSSCVGGGPGLPGLHRPDVRADAAGLRPRRRRHRHHRLRARHVAAHARKAPTWTPC